MEYISTRGSAPALSFEDAMLTGLATDGGLYVPRNWHRLDAATIASFRDAPYAAVALQIFAPFVEAATHAKLADLIADAYACFDDARIAPLTQLSDEHYLLELYHGPTLAFKDIAMQLLARLMDDALVRRGRRTTIIGATSGDTGGAAIHAFKGRAAADIFVLYPHGRVSDVQRRQMTTVADANVYALAIDGTFDDCQALVKALFNDAAFRKAHALSGVNSINWARVMAQIVYYFTSAAALGAPEVPVSFSVPTGNFGDIFAGYVAARMGLPIKRLMIATNVNDILARTLNTGRYQIGEVVATHSPSMDIQVSSNFERLLFELTGRDPKAVCAYMDALATDGSFTMRDGECAAMREVFAAARIDEAQTLAIMREVRDAHNIEIDPHTAVGIGAARQLEPPVISLATAHPAKFPQAAEAAYGASSPPPPAIADIMAKPERIHRLPNALPAVQDFIRNATKSA